MTEDDAKRLTSGEPVEIPLVGDGPFQLPICTDLKEIAVGESLAVMRFETIDGQRVDIPIAIGMLIEINDAASAALAHAVRKRDGRTVQ